MKEPSASHKNAIYNEISTEWSGICDQESPWETRLSTLIALIKAHNSDVSWVGAYLATGNDGVLWVNCYQGPVACTKIPPGRGVCGKSFRDQKTLIVPDVNNFPDHIACDSKSRSEIVIPIFRQNKIVGVLDLDSHKLDAFDETDAKFLENLLSQL